MGAGHALDVVPKSRKLGGLYLGEETVDPSLNLIPRGIVSNQHSAQSTGPVLNYISCPHGSGPTVEDRGGDYRATPHGRWIAWVSTVFWLEILGLIGKVALSSSDVSHVMGG